MRKLLLILVLGFTTVLSFAQKKELRTAEKAIKKQNFEEAMTAINSTKELIASANNKLKAKFYFLKGQALAGKKEYKSAANSLNKLISFEEKIGDKKYTDKASTILSEIVQEVSNKAIKLHSEKDYKNASENFYLTYVLSPTDTSFLYNAAISSLQSKDYDTSLKHYRELKSVGYTGITTMYMATNIESGKEEYFETKSSRDLILKSDTYTDPIDKKSESKSTEIIINMASILSEQGKYDEAVTAIKEARATNLDNLNLLLMEADFYIKLKKMDEFERLMKEAVIKDPSNPQLYFNLGVVNFNQKRIEEAKKYYLKAIELEKNYTDAYLNLAIVILDKESTIVEEMNNNLSDFKKYDELEKQKIEVYKKALPYLSKADSLNRNIHTVRTLLNIYENLEMEEKSKEFRVLYKFMREEEKKKSN